MITIEELDVINKGWVYRVPETEVVFWKGIIAGDWYIQNQRRGDWYLNNDLKWIFSEYSIADTYPSLSEALNTYNRSTTKVLPLNTDIIDNHKIE